MRLGIFGGTFDPIHYGHLLLAETAREQCALDEIRFIPAAVSPHKKAQVSQSQKHRLEMIRLAIGGHPQFTLSTREIERGGVSYTVETLEELHQENPDAELFFLVGADILPQFSTWHQPKRICELTTLIVGQRPYHQENDLGEFLKNYWKEDRPETIREIQVDNPAFGISSREIRQRIAEGRSIRYRTPRAVEIYIETHQLYQSEQGQREKE
ncbi:Nicotinic acid mononucleotide adenylyltransferase [Planctomycetales bacterium 10988]|nr:Nicotinic acid mononucleotide adenylyltransferase [Planctomycetales bacterium 10988]